MFIPDNYESAFVAISSMQFDGRDKLLNAFENMHNNYVKQQEQAAQAQQEQAAQQMPAESMAAAAPDTQMIDPLSIPAEDMTQQIAPLEGADMSQYVPIPITGGM